MARTPASTTTTAAAVTVRLAVQSRQLDGRLPLRDQAALFAKSHLAVGATGAAFTHVLWMPPGAQAILFWPGNDTEVGSSIGARYRRRKPFFHGWRTLLQLQRAGGAAGMAAPCGGEGGGAGNMRVVVGDGDWHSMVVPEKQFLRAVDGSLTELLLSGC